MSPGYLSISHLTDLESWVNTQKSIGVYGHSQGGGNCILLASKFKKIHYVCAINPSLPQTKHHSDADIDIYINQYDWVGALGGYAPTDSNVHHVSHKNSPHWSPSVSIDMHVKPLILKENVNNHTEKGESHNQKQYVALKVLLYLLRAILFVVILPFIILSLLFRALYRCAFQKPKFDQQAPIELSEVVNGVFQPPAPMSQQKPLQSCKLTASGSHPQRLGKHYCHKYTNWGFLPEIFDPKT